MERKKMTGKEWAELGFCLFLLIYFSILSFITPQYSAKAQLFPKVCLVAGFLLLILKFISLLVPGAKKAIEPEKEENGVHEEDVPVAESKKEKRKLPLRSVLSMIGWVVLTAICFYVLGIISASFICSLLFFLFATRMKWYKALILSTALAGALYLIFIVLLKLRLYSGLLF